MSETPDKMLRDVDGRLWVSFGDYALALHEIEKQQARIAELQGRIDAAIKIVYGQGKPELKASRMLEVLEQGAALQEGEKNGNSTR